MRIFVLRAHSDRDVWLTLVGVLQKRHNDWANCLEYVDTSKWDNIHREFFRFVV